MSLLSLIQPLGLGTITRRSPNTLTVYVRLSRATLHVAAIHSGTLPPLYEGRLFPDSALVVFVPLRIQIHILMYVFVYELGG